ncbi:MAG: hypothetical protein EXR92_03850, partial [Gemmatimonadetes bacterium]|nr:hypothetical protein [Gemmatimonadota bacterium]
HIGATHGRGDKSPSSAPRATELQACVGLAQMKKLAWRVERKKEIYRLYREGLSRCSQIRLFDQNLEHTTPWFIDSLADDRAGLMRFLKANGVGTRLMYPPINRQEAYQVAGSYPVSELVGEKGLWLPSAAQLTDEQVRTICELIEHYYTNEAPETAQHLLGKLQRGG